MEPEPTTPLARPVARLGWIALGLVAVAIGGVGIVVPGLPTTVFFVVAAWCFSRSSPRLEAWLLALPRVGPLVRDYRAGLGMPRAAKRAAVISIVIACSLSIVLADPLWVRLAIGITGIVGIAYIVWRVPTRPDAVATA
jgi:uncharacterized membrane protein YbaN (DUF454 family)